MRILKPTQLSNTDVNHITSIEAKCYPGFMCQLNDLDSVDDIYDYCESDEVTIVVFETGYMIFTDDEVVDLCSLQPLSYKQVLELIRTIPAGNYSADLRSTTSLPLLRALDRRGKIRLAENDSWDWNDETMVEVTITIP